MVRNDSRAQRFARTWLGLLLGGGCLVASAGDLAALTVTTRPLLPGLIWIQQEESETIPSTGPGQAETATGAAAAGSFSELHEALAAARIRLEELSKAAEAVAATGQLRQELAALKEENQQLIAELEARRGGDRELENVRQAAEARVAELSKTLEAATARAQQIDQELTAARWENAQLNTSLAQTRAVRREDQAKAREVQEALSAQLKALEADRVDAAGALGRLHEQLEDSEQRLTAATSAQADAQTRLAEMRTRLQQAEQETASAAERLGALEEQLIAAREQAASAQQERALALQGTAALASERDALRAQLATIADRLEQSEVANDRLESQVAELRAAAGTATDVARQNLVAVEKQIRELNDALGAIAPVAGAPTGSSPAVEPTAVVATDEPDDQAPGPASAAVDSLAAAARSGTAPDAAASRIGADLDAFKAAGTAEAESSALLADLSLEQRLHVQGLLAELNGTMDEQGLKMVVPGGVLFALDGEEIPDSAHDTLAKVAELIDMYDGRPVRIVGHTDALGDSAYNKTLSARRAGLVKQFFVDRFDVEEARLATEGMGEARPIASNATLEGRRANRRVEVLILD
jgi:outer membrane protein OmpA-like peptidoglycan-associated protein